MKNDATMENGATMTDDADIIINVLTTAPKERCKVYLKDEPLSLAKLQDRQRELADQMELAKKKGENLDFEALEGRLQEAKKAFETLGEAIGESHEITPERINRLFYEQVPENLNPEEQQARHIAVAYQNVLIPLNAMQVLLNASFSDVEESNKELIEPMGKLAISSQEGTVSNNNNVKPQQKYVDTPNPSAQQPPATPLVSIGDGGQFVVTPSQELIEAYTKDIIEPDTYLQEAEGSVAANHLGICVAAFQGKRRYFDNIDKKPLPITSSGTMGPGDMANGTVLHINGNHFIVIEQCAQSEAQYVDGTGTFYREGKRTRADGSCLLDGMNIIANGKSIKDDEVKKLREVIAETIDPEDVKQVLTAMIVTELTAGEEPQGIGAVTQGLIYGDKALAPILEEKRLEKEQKREKEELERQQQRLRDPRNAPPLLNDLLRQLANENDPVSRKEIGSACMKRIKALAATTCEQGELDTLEKAVEAICAATPETLPKAVSEASKPAQAVETKVVENTPGWSQGPASELPRGYLHWSKENGQQDFALHQCAFSSAQHTNPSERYHRRQ